jgi:adenosylcobyric acid synthase
VLHISIVRMPNTAIPEEYDALAAEPDVEVSFVDRPEDLGVPDMVILPGSEATIPDMLFLRETGMDAAIERAARGGALLFGICGGFQMMGSELYDPEGVEGAEPRAAGLGIFDMATTFTRQKIDERVDATSATAGLLGEGERVSGFELHGGQSVIRGDDIVPLFRELTRGSSSCPLAVATREYSAIGTYLHGILSDPVFRKRILEHLRTRKSPA